MYITSLGYVHKKILQTSSIILCLFSTYFSDDDSEKHNTVPVILFSKSWKYFLKNILDFVSWSVTLIIFFHFNILIYISCQIAIFWVLTIRYTKYDPYLGLWEIFSEDSEMSAYWLVCHYTEMYVNQPLENNNTF